MQPSKSTLLIILVLFSTVLVAQEQTHRWLGAYVTVQDVAKGSGFQPKSHDHFYLADPAYLGFSFRTANQNRWFQEFSLLGFYVDRETETFEVSLTSSPTPSDVEVVEQFYFGISTRYEYGKLLADVENRWIIPAVSLGIDPYLTYFKETPITKILEDETSSNTKVGARINVIPRLLVNLGGALSMDISAPIHFYNFSTGDNGWYHNYGFDEMTLRAGLLYKIN